MRPDGAPCTGAAWDVWRDGGLLVMGTDAELPDRCVKTGLPADGRTLEVRLLWLPSAWARLLLLNALFAPALARGAGTQVVVRLGICRRALAARRRALALTWALLLAGLAAGAAAAVAAEAVLFCLGLAFLLLAAAAYVARGLLVRVVRLDGRHVWLAGVHPDYVERLPQWRG